MDELVAHSSLSMERLVITHYVSFSTRNIQSFLVLISTVFLPLHFQTLKPIATCIRLFAYSGMASDRLR